MADDGPADAIPTAAEADVMYGQMWWVGPLIAATICVAVGRLAPRLLTQFLPASRVLGCPDCARLHRRCAALETDLIRATDKDSFPDKTASALEQMTADWHAAERRAEAAETALAAVGVEQPERDPWFRPQLAPAPKVIGHLPPRSPLPSA